MSWHGERRTKEEDRREKGKRNKRVSRKKEVHVTFKEKGRKGRWKRRRRRTETIIALSYHCTVINFLLSRESVPRLGPGLMTNHFHPAVQYWLFMIREHIRASHETSRAPIHLGPLLSLLGPSDNLKWAYSLTSPNSALDCDRHFSTSSAAYW